MTRPDSNPVESDLSAYLDEELSDFDRHRLEAQLHKDPAMFAELEAAREAHDALAILPRVDAPVDFSATIFDAARKDAANAGSVPMPAGKSARWNPQQWTGIAAALLLCSFGGWYFGRQSATPNPVDLRTESVNESPIMIAQKPTDDSAREAVPSAPAVESRDRAVREEPVEFAYAEKKEWRDEDKRGFETAGSLQTVATKESAFDEGEVMAGVPSGPAALDRAVVSRAPVVDIVVTPESVEQFTNVVRVLEAGQSTTRAQRAISQDANATVIEQSLPATATVALLNEFENAAPQQVMYQVSGTWDDRSNLIALGNTMWNSTVVDVAANAPARTIESLDEPEAAPPMFGYLYYDRDSQAVFLPAPPEPQQETPTADEETAESDPFPELALQERIARFNNDPARLDELAIKRAILESMHGRRTRANRTAGDQRQLAKSDSNAADPQAAAPPAADAKPDDAETAALFKDKLRQNFNDFDALADQFALPTQQVQVAPVRVRVTIRTPQPQSQPATK